MRKMSLWKTVSEQISQSTGKPFHSKRQRSVGGGCINQAFIIDDSQNAYFVKTNRDDLASMFVAEAAGLNEILASQSVRAPQPICPGVAEGQAYLVLEYLQLGSGDSRSAEDLGRQLAQMHRATRPHYGWDIENTIGSTPQINTWDDDWVRFFGQQRLRYQLQLTQDKTMLGLGEQLIAVLPAFFDQRIPASLLHGDLWGGNWGADENGRAVIFDPATYYGDRESDLAMTELFGGFPPRFYDAYRDAYPLDSAGYAVRKNLYQLYHILNHCNMFGGSYCGQANHMIQRLLAEVRG